MKKLLIFLFISYTCFLFSQEILLNIKDKPNNDGSALSISWDTSQIEASKIIIERETSDGEFIAITSSEESTGTFDDGSNIIPGIRYIYRLTAFDNNDNIMQIVMTTSESYAQWFNKDKISLLIFSRSFFPFKIIETPKSVSIFIKSFSTIKFLIIISGKLILNKSNIYMISYIFFEGNLLPKITLENPSLL